ncbi:MAG: hypothetical protein JWQ88_2509 [Rhodoferax sp.]|nr:hypothetical protein [Rhodoferax sp.]
MNARASVEGGIGPLPVRHAADTSGSPHALSAFDLHGPHSGFGGLSGTGRGATTSLPLRVVDSRVRVLVVDSDDDCLRRFARAVCSDAGLTLIATASDSADAMQCLAKQPPEVLIVEPGMGLNFGMALIRHCAARMPRTDILVRTQVGDDERVLAAIEAGACGYVYRDAEPAWIAASIHAVREGGALISPGVARRVLARFRLRVVGSGQSVFGAVEEPAQAEAEGSPLSEAQVGVLRLVACGTPLPEIADVLGMPPRAVLAHVKNVYRRLGLRGGAAVGATNPCT